MPAPRLSAALLAAAAVAGCGGDGGGREPVFVFRLHGGLPAAEAFRVRGSSPDFVAQARAQLQLPVGERRLFPVGRLRAGDGGVNAPWSWHLAEVELVAMAVELCDGRPSMVEADLAYWVGTVRSFCPWSGYVHAEE